MTSSTTPGPHFLTFHLMSSVYLFNTTQAAMGGKGVVLSASDRALTSRLRDVIGSFVLTGVIAKW